MKRIIVLVAALGLLAGACAERGSGDLGSVGGTDSPTPTASATGSPTPPHSPTTHPTQPGRTMTFQVWFHYRQLLFVSRRTEPFSAAVGAASMNAMLAGPSRLEAAAGVGSTVPAGTTLLGLTIKDGVATANLSREFESGGGTASMRMRLAQLTYTLTQFPTVQGVNLEIEGTPVRAFGGEGIVLDRPMTRRSFRDLLPQILVESPLIGRRVPSPVTVSGTADVFEATVSISILDAGGEEIVRTFTMATCGTGCRGTYSDPVRYHVSRTQPGTVRVYESSAKDGRPINVVDIPVTLVA